MKRRVLVADDHPLARDALQLAVRSVWPDCQIDEAGSVAELGALVRSRADYRIAVVDLMLPDAKGFSALLLASKALPDTPVAVISARDDAQTIATASVLGAAAFITKATALSGIAEVLKRVVAGERVFPSQPGAPGPQPLANLARQLNSLSGAQLKVLTALADGRLNKQIAADMNITEATVKAHLTAIFRKLNVGNRTQAVLAVRSLFASRDEGRDAI